METELYLGLDIGSTTIKSVILDAKAQLLACNYIRHNSAIHTTLTKILEQLIKEYPKQIVRVAISGSGALEIAKSLNIAFVQELLASSRCLRYYAPETEVAVELGGEDAKILYFKQGGDNLRMNEACAGGTGAFIDQMATLLHTDASGLNKLAASATRIYPIASRCGVFARTDLAPLLNEGVPREDLAASIFQAVVEQTISGLACGNPIKGKIAFLGGPLHFLDQLKQRFITTLDLAPEDICHFDNAQFSVALGVALHLLPLPNNAKTIDNEPILLEELLKKAQQTDYSSSSKSQLAPLFLNEADYQIFAKQHQHEIPNAPLSEARGDLFLGVDLGSTTVKAVLVDSAGIMRYSWYQRNLGDPLTSLFPALASMLETLPKDAEGKLLAEIVACITTGYGAELACAALGAQNSQVETVAHLTAAHKLLPETTYLIDIGGQDMKCIKVKNGHIAGLTLNEACSAGCGAFLETFANSLNLSMAEFVQAALFAKNPVDLGSRCTVFMNSRVRQAQKEGAKIGDIAAGLCYAVIRNALHKVLRIKDVKELGKAVLVQGGTFLNDAILRVLENALGEKVLRPKQAGLMGAWGAALLALANYQPEISPKMCLTSENLRNMQNQKRNFPCTGCGNHCRLTLHTFANKRRFISGNRCEKGSERIIKNLNKNENAPKIPNLYAWKYENLFNYTPLELDQAPRGIIGIPRVLNIWEHYPYWFTFFTELGFRVILSPESTREIFSLGFSSMPSQTVCYPAKLAHGHILALLNMGVQRIFYPCLPTEKGESSRYNCPVVAGYPEVIRLNTQELQSQEVEFLTPFVCLEAPAATASTLAELLDINLKTVKNALKKADLAQSNWRKSLREQGEATLEYIKKSGIPSIVLCGRPYHVDPAVHHGLPDYIASLNCAVLSEDSIAHLTEAPTNLRVRDQWGYHSRLYRAAALVGNIPNLELVQLTSFGCGLDAITSDQLEELLESYDKIHTLIKIDEGSSQGAARIRIRSLLAAMQQKKLEAKNISANLAQKTHKIATFETKMRKTHTILAPQMSPLHFSIISAAFNREGYNLEVLPKVSQAAIDLGLRYVHNDSCYPAIVVIGQILEALNSGKYDTEHTAILLAQTCGPCRASNYAALLNRAMTAAGFKNIPIVNISGSNAGKNLQPGFKLTLKFLHSLIKACLYGDMLQRVSTHTMSYEINTGESLNLLNSWQEKACQIISQNSNSDFASDMREIVQDFSQIKLSNKTKPKVGIVGEILLKYHPDANNEIVKVILEEGGEPVLTDLMDFFLYCFLDPVYRWQNLGGKMLPALFSQMLVWHIELMRRSMREALKNSKFWMLNHIHKLAKSVSGIVSLGNQAGEGWLLTAEMLEFLEANINNILCLQPFGCLPNHITGKGVLKELRRLHSKANLMAVDFDPSASSTNQHNRIKLFMSQAHDQLHETLHNRKHDKDRAKEDFNITSQAQIADKIAEELG